MGYFKARFTRSIDLESPDICKYTSDKINIAIVSATFLGFI